MARLSNGLYTELLELLGCARMPSRRVEHHLGELTRTFDAAAAVVRTPGHSVPVQAVGYGGGDYAREPGHRGEIAFCCLS
ncbi:hypothetical protein ACE3MS_29315 [Paenibacillus dendritiformis]|uniref:hypothetical protein n=1 Tax=Paenibacillus dendritiformis TaxID=130049 RepID=UPI0036497AB1